MDWQGHIGREKPDGEAATKRARQRCWLVGKLHRQHDQDIRDADSEPQQDSKQYAVHRKIIAKLSVLRSPVNPSEVDLANHAAGGLETFHLRDGRCGRGSHPPQEFTACMHLRFGVLRCYR